MIDQVGLRGLDTTLLQGEQLIAGSRQTAVETADTVIRRGELFELEGEVYDPSAHRYNAGIGTGIGPDVAGRFVVHTGHGDRYYFQSGVAVKVIEAAYSVQHRIHIFDRCPPFKIGQPWIAQDRYGYSIDISEVTAVSLDCAEREAVDESDSRLKKEDGDFDPTFDGIDQLFFATRRINLQNYLERYGEQAHKDHVERFHGLLALLP